MPKDCPGVRVEPPLGTPTERRALERVDGGELRLVVKRQKDVPNPLSSFFRSDGSSAPVPIGLWSCQKWVMIKAFQISLGKLANFDER